MELNNFQSDIFQNLFEFQTNLGPNYRLIQHLDTFRLRIEFCNFDAHVYNEINAKSCVFEKRQLL